MASLFEWAVLSHFLHFLTSWPLGRTWPRPGHPLSLCSFLLLTCLLTGDHPSQFPWLLGRASGLPHCTLGSPQAPIPLPLLFYWPLNIGFLGTPPHSLLFLFSHKLTRPVASLPFGSHTLKAVPSDSDLSSEIQTPVSGSSLDVVGHCDLIV